jgi:hypothetical protein
MRTGDPQAQRLGCVEPSVANERESHTKRVRTRADAPAGRKGGENVGVWKLS